MHGAISLAVGGASVVLAAACGIPIGLAAGYWRGLDDRLLRLMDLILAFPAVILALAIVAAVGPSLGNVMTAIAFAMSDEEIGYSPATALAAAIRRKAVSPVEVVDAVLRRIERLNPALNAYCTVTPEPARTAARRAEAAVLRGEALGPLHGVPVSVKDTLWTAGVRTTMGSALYADFVPDEDALEDPAAISDAFRYPALAVALGDRLAEWRARMDPSLVALVEEGQRMSGPDVARALMRRHDLWLRVHAFFGRYGSVRAENSM